MVTREKGKDLKSLMDVDKTKSFIKEELPETFISHQFITKLLEKDSELYGALLCRYRNLTTTQMVIGKYLSNYQRQLGIKIGNKVPSQNILQKLSKCAIWIQTEKQE